MALKLNSLFFTTVWMVGIFSTMCVSLDHGSLQDGTWQPMDPNDPKVVEIAKFAIKEANKKFSFFQEHFKYVKVLTAKYVLFPGHFIVYDFLVKATGTKSGTKDYMTFVNQDDTPKHKGERELLGFSPTSP